MISRSRELSKTSADRFSESSGFSAFEQGVAVQVTGFGSGGFGVIDRADVGSLSRHLQQQVSEQEAGEGLVGGDCGAVSEAAVPKVLQE